ncbi:MAG: thiamine-phosphate pyrophosphorylase [Hyphomicrobiales bacterium]|nr:thiamine-phosphate pyrophosphorylase [Hyphomicrobiales bacterium]
MGSHAGSMGTPGRKAVPPRVAPRLYLVTPPVGDPALCAQDLAAALEAADVAAVLMRFAPGDDRTLIKRVKALTPIVQDRGAALMLEGHTDIVVRAGADGAHLPDIDAFSAALSMLKPQRIAGCGGLKTRHDAMLAAEAGADYVMFGEPDADGRRPGFDAVLERVSWWAEVFEAPCVGFAASLDEVEALVQSGADFIAIGDPLWNDAATIREAARRLAVGEAVQ